MVSVVVARAVSAAVSLATSRAASRAASLAASTVRAESSAGRLPQPVRINRPASASRLASVDNEHGLKNGEGSRPLLLVEPFKELGEFHDLTRL